MVEIYVDGCYNESKNLTGWGYVIVDDGKVLHSKSGSLSDPEVTSMYQVGGELMSTIEGLEYCKNNSIKDVLIVYDYKGIECWSTGEWKRNKSVTKCYYEYMKLIKQFINYRFKKIKSHSGIKFNDMADNLSKVACGVI